MQIIFPEIGDPYLDTSDICITNTAVVSILNAETP